MSRAEFDAWIVAEVKNNPTSAILPAILCPLLVERIQRVFLILIFPAHKKEPHDKEFKETEKTD